MVGKTRCPSCKSKGKDKHHDNLILYADGGGYCFSCGYVQRGNKPYTATNFGNRGAGEVVVLSGPKPLPEDIKQVGTNCVGYSWIGKYLSRVPQWLLWSEENQWLIFPYFIEEELIAWQARNFGSYGPKWYTFGNVKQLYYIRGKQQNTCILVEDIVSALKIEEAGYCAMPVFGSQIGLERLRTLCNRFSDIRIWLDPDKRVESIKEAQKASLEGMAIKVLFSDKDPKELTCEEIQDIL